MNLNFGLVWSTSVWTGWPSIKIWPTRVFADLQHIGLLNGTLLTPRFVHAALSRGDLIQHLRKTKKMWRCIKAAFRLFWTGPILGSIYSTMDKIFESKAFCNCKVKYCSSYQVSGQICVTSLLGNSHQWSQAIGWEKITSRDFSFLYNPKSKCWHFH